MRRWNPFALLQLVGGGDASRMADLGVRWTRAFRDFPELRGDLIMLGRLLETEPVRLEGGVEMADPIDPMRMAYEKGQADLAKRLLALGGVSRNELRVIMEEDQNV